MQLQVLIQRVATLQPWLAADVATKSYLFSHCDRKLIGLTGIKNLGRPYHQDQVVKRLDRLIIAMLFPRLYGRFCTIENVTEEEDLLGLWERGLEVPQGGVQLVFHPVWFFVHQEQMWSEIRHGR